MGSHRQEPYARYRIRQYEGQADGEAHQPESLEHYEDVARGARQAVVRKSFRGTNSAMPSMKTTVTSFGEGLRKPSKMFGSLKKAGQRFVGADQIEGRYSIHRLAGRKSKCQCRHHQPKLIGQGEGRTSNNEETSTNNEHRNNSKNENNMKNNKTSNPERTEPNMAFYEAKKVFRDRQKNGNDL